MPTFPRIACLSSFSCIAIIAILYFYSLSPASHHLLVLEQTEFALTDAPLGKHNLLIRIHNPNITSQQIIGLQGSCVSNCCVSTPHQDQIEVAPGETFEYCCELDLKRTGDFAITVALYLSDNGLRSVHLTFSGNIVEVHPNDKIPK